MSTSRRFRIGVHNDLTDPFWVQVQEATLAHARHLPVSIIPLDLEPVHTLTPEGHLLLIEELQAQEIDAVICIDWSPGLARTALERGMPIVHLTECDIRHPLFVSPLGLYDVGRDLGRFIAERLAGHGRVLAVGGLLQHIGEDGQSRVTALTDTLSGNPGIRLRHIPSLWSYDSAYEQVRSAARPGHEPFDALVGLSDSVALGARDAAWETGLLIPRGLVAGINGDPLALAAIVDGTMTATVDTPAVDFAEQALDLAFRAAQKQPLPAHFSFRPLLVTADNVSEVATRKLIAIAELPSRLMGDNRQQAQQRLSQLETSLRINRQVGGVLDRSQLLAQVADSIRATYGYNVVHSYLLDAPASELVRVERGQFGPEQRIPLDQAALLAETVRRNQPIFIPDSRFSHRFPPDPDWPNTRSRIIVPIRLGETILGLIDLHSFSPQQHLRQDLVGLQSLADQLGVALHNADLYGQAVQARAAAEKANQIKTRLLANVSHELRTPLNVILGYASAAVASPNPYRVELPAPLVHDLHTIYGSGEHLMRLINDLLDLSRAEFNELDLLLETIDARAFLEEAFRHMVDSLPARREVTWRLELPERLPLIQADPLRLRQILLNLLHNAHKFTARGEIILGAEAAPPHLHLWVHDTGRGIPVELQEHIFEPFATSLQARRSGESIGLGLSITHRLVVLHGGSLTLDSQPGRGSVFHVYLPLPSLSGRTVAIPADAQPVLVVVSAVEPPPLPIRELSQRRGWTIYRLHSQTGLEALFHSVRPAALAWDLSSATLADWNLIQAIRALPAAATLPFIVFGAGLPSAPGSGVGLTQFLVKPLSRQTLLDSLDGIRSSMASGQVLIIENDAQTRELYASIVARSLPGYGVLAVNDGTSALDYLAHQVPSLVILHLSLPDMDGLRVLETIRSQPATRAVPVVVMSGRTLSFEDVRRLDHLYVTFHSRQLLSEDEMAGAFQQAVTHSNVLPPQTSLVVKYAMAYLQQHYADDISRQELANAIGVSKDYLTHIFRQELDLSPVEYLTRLRLHQAKILLRTTRSSIAAIAGQVGFDDVSYFDRVFRKQTGCSPSEFRERPVSG